ncbi:nucleotidyltransferase domain-containing protein [Patescibacteria group bacterium]|nr:nucleotidyltransferase domain-containing protein [Patescibacteria group bacterium]
MNPAFLIGKKFIKKVRQAGIPVDAAYLFGSFAKNTAKKYSDIDICVISKKFGKDYFDEAVKLRHLTWDVDDRIEPVPYKPEDLNDRYSTLAHEIKTFGILLTK